MRWTRIPSRGGGGWVRWTRIPSRVGGGGGGGCDGLASYSGVGGGSIPSCFILWKLG